MLTNRYEVCLHVLDSLVSEESVLLMKLLEALMLP